MIRFEMVCNDLKPSVKAQLKWKDGTTVDLTDATAAKFHMADQDGNVLIDETATILPDRKNGWVQYDWQDARGEAPNTKPKDTAVDPGIYPAEFEITFDDSKTLTFPTKKDLVIVFRKEIA